MSSARLIRLQELARTAGAIGFEVNFSSVDAWFPDSGIAAGSFVNVVHHEFGRSVRCDITTVEGRKRVNMSLG